MTVQQLIEKLSDFPVDAEVHISYDYGDHSHTRVAPKVRDINEEEVKFSEYHRMPAVVEWSEDDDVLDDDEYEEQREKVKLVVVLS